MKKIALLIVLLLGCNTYDNAHIVSGRATEGTKFVEVKAEEIETHSIFVLEFRKYNYHCWINDDIIERDENDIYLSYENDNYTVYIIDKNLRYINFNGSDFKQAGKYLGIEIENCISEN